MLSFPLRDGAVLQVWTARAEMLGQSVPVSFAASSGALTSELRDRLDAALPVEWSGSESALGALVLTALGDDHTPRAVNTRAHEYTRSHTPSHPSPGMSDDPWAD
jgi:hypothetical protein